VDEIRAEKTDPSPAYNSEIATSHLLVPEKYVRMRRENTRSRKKSIPNDYYLPKQPLIFASKTRIPPKKLLGTNIIIGPLLHKIQPN
jgi:hypothetical protein